MTRFLRRNKIRVLITLCLVVALIAIGLFGFSFLKGKVPQVDHIVLTGNQIGDISLVHVPSEDVLFSANIKDMATGMDIPSKGNSIYIEMEKPLDGEVEEVVGEFVEEVPEEVVLPTTGRNLEKVGEIDGYLVVAGTIEKGDYWLKVQKEIMPSLDPTSLLSLGKKVNPDGRVHPIYPKERVLFLYKGELPTQPVDSGNSPAMEQSQVDNAEPVTPEPIEDTSLFSDVVVSDYLYQFSEDGFYVLDNLASCVYEIIKLEDGLKLLAFASLGEGMVADSFRVCGDVVYYSIAQNNVVYVARNGAVDKIHTPDAHEAWDADGDDLYFVMNKKVYHVDSVSGEYKSVYLGERTSDIRVAEDLVYISNDFGINNLRSVVHRFGRDLSSEGWVEMYYSIDTQIVHAGNSLLLNQNMQSKYSKLVISNEAVDGRREQELDALFTSLSYGEDRVYGMIDKVLYVYDAVGKPIGNYRTGGTDAYLLRGDEND